MTETPQTKPGGRILVVDDEQDLMLALVAALELDDYDVTGFDFEHRGVGRLAHRHV